MLLKTKDRAKIDKAGTWNVYENKPDSLTNMEFTENKRVVSNPWSAARRRIPLRCA